MRGRPPKRSFTPEQEQAADAFISAAEPSADQQGKPRDASRDQDRQRPSYPWEEPRVREDVKKGYALRLPEPLYLKLKYISEETGASMNQLCNEAVETLVEEQLEQLT